MAEAFSNKVARAAGIVTSTTGGAIGITTNLITGISTVHVAVNDLVDTGKIRVANKQNGSWIVNQWIKKAILLSFRINKMEMIKGPYTTWYDKVTGKTVKWKEKDWKKAGYRHVPNGVGGKDQILPKM